MSFGKLLKNKLNLIYLLPLYILTVILFVVLITTRINSEETKSNKIEISNSDKAPLVKVKLKDLVETMDIEEYLIGVVAAEMPPSFEKEALKAQAVAARTYILSKQGKKDDKHPDADVCVDSAHCKAYCTERELNERWGNDWQNIYREKIKNAVTETRGEIVTYNNEPIIAVFHSTSTGKTENSEDVWQTETPYLKSVESPGEELSPRFKSEVEISTDEFIRKISALNSEANFSGARDKWVSDYVYTEGGAVNKVNIGGCIFEGTDIRSAFGLRSALFEIKVGENVLFKVTGNGHGVGMSQYGANYAATQGNDYKEILKKYYTDTEIKKAY